jgi:hypothetical protein
MPRHRIHLTRAAVALAAIALPWGLSPPAGAQPLHEAVPRLAHGPADPAARAQPRLPTVELRVGDAQLSAEVACDREAQARGLMHRDSLGEGEAMLFAFERPSWLSFWMKDTSIPLTVAYLDAQGVIRELHDLQPLSTTRIDSQGPDLQFALEVPRGWFLRHGVGVGSAVTTTAGPLAGFRCGPPEPL